MTTGARNTCTPKAAKPPSRMEHIEPRGSGTDSNMHLSRPESSPSNLRNQHSVPKVSAMSLRGPTANVELAYRACLQTPYTTERTPCERLTESLVSPLKSTAHAGTPPRIRGGHRSRSLKLRHSCSPRKAPTDVKATFEPQSAYQTEVGDDPEVSSGVTIMRMPGVACRLFCIDDNPSSPESTVSPLSISILSDDDSDTLSVKNQSGIDETSQIYAKVEKDTTTEVTPNKRSVYSKTGLNKYLDVSLTPRDKMTRTVNTPVRGKYEHEFMVGGTLDANFFKDAVEKVLKNVKDNFDSFGQKDFISPLNASPICGSVGCVQSSVNQGNDYCLAEELPPREVDDAHGSTDLEQISAREIFKSEITRRRRKLDDIDLISRIGCIFQEFHLNDDLSLLPPKIEDEHHVIYNVLDQTIPESDDVTDHVLMIRLGSNLYRLKSGELTFDIPVF
ncbi:uncharacterized protein LOC124266230 [Haliotis rubra]|uniref:uncharacterized protein LOC124266230 n=1 Tax=Haliotis rubra TaxID=36100 RepID=UPI001EE51343|nr:uncharacterized protein LOC124266230 [Haliotis rubra]